MEGEDFQESKAVGDCSEVVYFVQSRTVARMTSQHVCVDIQDLYKVSPDRSIGRFRKSSITKELLATEGC